MKAKQGSEMKCALYKSFNWRPVATNPNQKRLLFLWLVVMLVFSSSAYSGDLEDRICLTPLLYMSYHQSNISTYWRVIGKQNENNVLRLKERKIA